MVVLVDANLRTCLGSMKILVIQLWLIAHCTKNPINPLLFCPLDLTTHKICSFYIEPKHVLKDVP